MRSSRGKSRRAGTRRVGAVKRRYVKRVRFAPKNKAGFFQIVRKLPEFWLQNTATAGVPRLGWISGGSEVAYTGTTMQLGTLSAGMNGSVDIPFAMNFRLSDIINYTDITSIADIAITTSANANIYLQPNGLGNIVLANTYINGLASPQQDSDAATKLYVDNLVTTGFAFHQLLHYHQLHWQWPQH